MRTYITIAIVVSTVITGIYLSNGWIIVGGVLLLCFLPRRMELKIPAPEIVQRFAEAKDDTIWYIRIIIFVFLAFLIATSIPELGYTTVWSGWYSF